MKLRTRLLTAFTLLLVVTLVANYLLVASLGRHALRDQILERVEALSAVLLAAGQHGLKVERSTEKLISDQMIAEARIAAHLVDVAENYANLSTEEINRRLSDIADSTVLDEFWITDEKGHAYLRNRQEIDFTFPSGPTERNQAWEFWHLLQEDRAQFAQRAMEREYDGEVFKYAGVSGIDRPRIVQVGFDAASLKQLVAGMTAEDLARAVVGHGGLLRLRSVGAAGELYMDTALSAPAGGGARIEDAELLKMIGNSLRNNTPVTRIERDRVTVSSPAGTEDGTLYSVVSTFDTGPIMATIRRALRLVALLTGSVLLAGILLAVRASQEISRPIQALAQEAAEIGQGNFERQVRLKAGGEVGALADAFNRMVTSLKAHVEELQRTTAAKEQLESEIRIAARVQTWMLPKRLPRVSGVRISASTEPARLVGGDFYDFMPLPGGRLGFAIGDASGKGLPGALYAAQSLSVVRALARRSTTVGEVLSGANGVLLASGAAGGLFTTIFYALYDPLQRALNFANAGHCPPILVRGDGAPEPLRAENSLPIGLTEEFEAVEHRMTLQPDELLVLYSDGVTDARNQEGEFFGQQRLLECVARHRNLDPRQIASGITGQVRDFIGRTDPTDDITVLVLRTTA